MKTFYKLIFLSLSGFIITGAYIIYDRQMTPVKIKAMVKVNAPYPSFIYATGIVETKSTNIPVGSTVSGVVSKLFVQVGQEVKMGDALFKIDSRDTQAKIELARAKIMVANVTLKKILDQYKIDRKLYIAHVISKKKYLDSLDDLAIAKANLSLKKAELTVLEKELKRHVVCSPITGEVLQCKIKLGEYIDSSRISLRTIVIGTKQLNLRVDINENDLFRFKPKSPAVGFIRNQPQIKIPLVYQYTEPYIVPKIVLTGLSTERTDLRVLQVLYHLEKPKFPLYVGQQLDIFIEAPAKDSL